MTDRPLNPSQYNPPFLSKTSSTRSCENLLCLTKRCNEDDTKDKERILNHQYFEKLSLKKFNNSSLINQSYYEKDRVQERSLKRDKSTQDSEFQNIVINTNKHDHIKYPNNKVKESKQYCFEQTQRINRCSSHRQLERPQLISTERSISKQLEHDFRRIEDLERLRGWLEAQIHSLDRNIDKYYLIYTSKLQELKKIQSKMNEIYEEERIIKKVPSNDDLKGFRKKSFWEDFNGSKPSHNQKKPQNTQPTSDPRPYNNYRKHPSVYQPNTNITFVKKAF